MYKPPQGALFPTCGYGSLLIKAGREVGSPDFSLFEQEANGSTWALAIMNMLSPKGLIPKKIQFQSTRTPNLYNLALGDTNPETGQIDDLVISNNAGSEKVLATVVSAVYAFFDNHPEAYVYATGSSDARTRLYRIGINKFYGQMIKDFYLYGQVGDEFYEFEIGNEYKGYLAQRKFK